MFKKYFSRKTTGRIQNFKWFPQFKRVKMWVEDCGSAGLHNKNHTKGNVETAKSSSKAIENFRDVWHVRASRMEHISEF
jgi:hypothetical protein